ncbi:chitobiase/beta-hexosaminidase C-terminal domain-containing protein [Geobacter sp.]|uniref:chitobiase/beta-hexosaminidase C-terminal domain-containing protein n=1 Tax=Geobacter sp. TaxID=46610 RepID=UPI0026108AA3|nr:chitobiase/beta-hexosaminidase C-terminal domain-containing protein [Geobacter sp.]
MSIKARFKVLVALLIIVISMVSASMAAAAVATYTYDELNRLKRVDYDDGTYIDYTYDEIGNRLTTATNAQSDTTPPMGAVIINGGAAATNSPAVTLSLTCNDANGCAQMQFSNDNATWSAIETYVTTKAWTLATGDGTTAVYARFKDTTGNWSTIVGDTIVLDTAVPTTNASPGSGIFATAQSVTLTCADGTGSGCDKVYYTTDGTTPTTASSVYATALNVSATTTLKYFATDKAGNTGGEEPNVHHRRHPADRGDNHQRRRHRHLNRQCDLGSLCLRCQWCRFHAVQQRQHHLEQPRGVRDEQGVDLAQRRRQ